MSRNIYFYFDYSNLQSNREISQETQNRITIFFIVTINFKEAVVGMTQKNISI